MGAYESIEKDMVSYELGKWVRTHDVLVLWDEHGMIHMLLTRRMVCVYQYLTYGHGQAEGCSWLGLIDGDIGLLRDRL
jgi:hypothetical protein